MTTDTKDIWIKEGYKIFAISGQGNLKIEPLAKMVGKSKSSFYHHFADIEIFIELLLKYHIEQSKIIAQKEKQAQKIDPELINILLAHKIDLLFNRQLRINQNIELYSSTLDISNRIVGDAFVNVWVKDLGLNLSRKQLEGIFTLALENFFLQINTETLNYEWLSKYFQSLKKIAIAFI
ncbi:MAG: TetR/AcrR family transcriptional regulator [Flectobacillus sp.]|uniref:TetR/AcrR family transcriptional regulator n=1 Tax=Flectobacillus sp. TaxID=50419 RepID=UPI003B997C34